MGFKDILARLNEKNREKKENLRMALEQDRIMQVVEDRKKSANERELERFIKEEREKMMNEELKEFRRQKDEDIKFNHNPLNVQNITNHTDWDVLKERNLFSRELSGASVLKQRNMFVGVPSVINPRMNMRRVTLHVRRR